MIVGRPQATEVTRQPEEECLGPPHLQRSGAQPRGDSPSGRRERAFDDDPPSVYPAGYPTSHNGTHSLDLPSG